MTIPSQPNPYVGLRPFFAQDSRTFFGRDEQISELQAILHSARFLPVVGGSGSGKSSLVRAGLIPRIGAGFLVGDRDHWTTVICRPGDAPINNFATALAQAMGAPLAVDGADGLEANIRIALSGGARDFILERLGARSSMLILVDQFEELFAFRGASADDEQLPSDVREHLARRRAEAADYVDLLLGLAETTEAPVFVVLTMRSDFLGDCDMFHGLPEAMNKARYLVPRLAREQMRQAVEGPALMVGAHMTARLVDRLINALGDRADRLPVLQHALQRTYDDWAIRGGAGPIDIEHFEAAGGLERALEQDAEAALGTVDAKLAERIFRALTDTDVSLRRVRRPCRVRALAAATGADRAQVEAVIAAFRANDRNFLYLARDGEPDNPRVDISHESLIRQWPHLAGWVDAERRARDTYLRILASARSQADGERELMREREFTVQKGLWDGIGATAAWAERYARASDDFPVAERFVEESRVAVEQERQERRARELHDALELARKRRARKRFWIGTGVVGAGVLAVILLLLVVANRSLDEAARANRLAAIRDYAVSDPTMAAALLRDLDQAQEFQWSDIAAMRTVAGAPLARILEDSVADMQVSRTPNSARLVMLKHDGSLIVWDQFDSAARVIRSGAAHGSQVTVDAAMTLAVVSDTIGGRLHLVHLSGDPQPRTLGDSIPDRRIPRLSSDG